MLLHAKPSSVSLRMLILALSLGMYVGAFAAPYEPNGWFKNGCQMFLAGLLYFWAIWISFSWWSNVFYWAALVYLFRREWLPAAWWGLLATALAGAWAVVGDHAIGWPGFQPWFGSVGLGTLGALCLLPWAQ